MASDSNRAAPGVLTVKTDQEGLVVETEYQPPKPSNEEDQLRLLAGESISFLRAFMASTGQDAEAMVKARIANGAIASWTRNQQAEGARRALDWQIVRDVAVDKAERRKYIQETQPSHRLFRPRLAPGGTNGKS